MNPGKIAYTMSRFPHLPETFILREMDELAKQGWQLALYPLLLQQQTVTHADTEKWLREVRPIPILSGTALSGAGRSFLRQPATISRLWWQTVTENLPDLHMLARAVALFPKAVSASRLMKADGIRHIHAHYATHPALFAWLIHRLTGISYSVTVHAHDIFVRRAMLATKLQAARFVVAISEFNREYLVRNVGSSMRDKIHIVHCGLTPALYRPRPAPGGQRPLQVMNIGSLQPYKGQSYLIEACALLKKQGIPFQCRIIGGGEERHSLQRLIERLQLTENVQLLGPQPQEKVARLLPTATCYVQPSIVTAAGKMEGIPVALMEALASCVPVVATKLSGIPELVKDGETGYLVPPADAAALARSLAHVYESPAAARATAVAGRELVLQEFNLQKNVIKLAALFNRYMPTEQPAITQKTAINSG